MPFTSASILPILAVGAYFAGVGDGLFNILNFVLCIFGVLIAHLSVNVLNDYFDFKDGTDEENNDYFQQVSGGSRAIELGLITLAGTKKAWNNTTIVALLIGGVVLFLTNPANVDAVLMITLIGLFLGYLHGTSPKTCCKERFGRTNHFPNFRSHLLPLELHLQYLMEIFQWLKSIL